MLLRNSFRCGTAKVLSDRGDFVRNRIQSPGRCRYRDLAYAQRRRRERSRRCLLERFGQLLAHLRFKQRTIRVFRFVSCDQPQTAAHVDGHENNKRRADAACHFPPALGNVLFGRQQNFARIAAHARVNSPRHGELALQLLVRSQPLFQLSAFPRGELAVEIIEKFVGAHASRKA